MTVTTPTGPSSAVDLSRLWGVRVVPGTYARHPGLVHEPRPRRLLELFAGTARWADRDLLVQGDRRLTHGEFQQAVPAAAALLREQGVQPGQHVLVLSYNRLEFPLVVWACWWLGAVPVLGNRWWGPEELQHALALAQPVLSVSDLPDPSPLAAHLPIESFSDPAAHRSPPAAHEPGSEDEPALVLFTSGSSGLPKGVVLSQRSVIANQHNLLRRSRRLPQDLDSDAQQAVTLVCTPLFHIGGVSNILTAVITGARLVLTEGRFDPAQVLELIERERVQTWGGVPTMAVRVLEHPDLGRRDLSSLRSWPLGGAPLPPSLLERMTTALPQLAERGLANTWGMTESGGFVTVAGNADLRERPGTVGRPYPCAELRIDQPDTGGVGEILLRSPTVMLGYLGVDDGTVDSEGWLRTGDLGHLDADGYLYLDGRSKDIVIRGGENIACASVEAALLAHPDVVEAAAFGVPHEELGEELVAVVRCRDGAAVTAEQLSRHLRDRLAYFAVPTQWEITQDPLPTLAGEKVDKRSLRAGFATGT